MIIAIDFDGTIVRDMYPAIGKLRPDAVKCINKLYDDGHYIIIWTCREGIRLYAATRFLDMMGVKYHKVNGDEPGNLEKFGSAGRKVYADVYIDDRQPGGLPPWQEIYERISKRKIDD